MLFLSNVVRGVYTSEPVILTSPEHNNIGAEETMELNVAIKKIKSDNVGFK